MSTALDRIVTLDISIKNSRLSQAGFGRAALFWQHTLNSDAYRLYTDPADMITDGFLETDSVVIDARAMMSQSPAPVDFLVFKRVAPVAQKVTVTVSGATITHPYNINLSGALGTGVATYTSDGTPTVAEIIGNGTTTGLTGAIVALAIGLTVDNLTGSSFDITSSQAGIPFTATETDAQLSIAPSVANVGITTDFAAAELAQPDFYGILLPNHDDVEAKAAMPVVQAMRRIMGIQTNNATTKGATYDANSAIDPMAYAKKNGYTRSFVEYVSSAANPVMAAWMGACLPQVPGSITWKFKELIGVAAETATVLTSNAISNIVSKNGNYYSTVAGHDITAEGTVGSGEFIDIIHGVDHLYALIQGNVIAALINQTGKVGMSSAGLATVDGAISAGMHTKMIDGLIARSRVLPNGELQAPGYTTTPPRIQDLSASDRAARRVPATHPFRAEGTLEGAIHFTNIAVTVSV